MTDTHAETPAPAGEVLNEEAEDALFAELASAKAPVSDDPATPVEETPTPESDDEGKDKAAAPAAADPTPDPSAAPAAAAPAAAAKDIWADAPAELRAAHEEAMQRADQKYRSDIGRQASYQRRIASLEDELKAKTAAPAAAADPATKPQALREREPIKKALEDYPEVMGPLLDALEPMQAENDDLRRTVSSLTQDRREAQISAQEQALQVAHPDWKEATSSPEFVEWLNTRPKAIREIIERNAQEIVDAEEAITVVGDFKAHYALTHPRPTPQADPKPSPAPDPAPTKLADKRAAQLKAVTSSPASKPGAIPTGAGADDDAMFNHFVGRKAAKR